MTSAMSSRAASVTVRASEASQRRGGGPVQGSGAAAASGEPALSRRQLLSAATAASLAAAGAGGTAAGLWAAPPEAAALELAPLGKVERVGGGKLTGLSPEEVRTALPSAAKPGGTHAHCCAVQRCAVQ